MIDQVENLKTMIAATQAWKDEVDDAGKEADHIHLYANLDAHHDPFKTRISIRSASWSTDHGFDACSETSQQEFTIDLPRDIPADDADALETQYKEVCTRIRDLCNQLTQASYSNGALVAQLLVQCGEVVLDDIAENEVRDPESTDPQKVVWWCNVTVTPQTS